MFDRRKFYDTIRVDPFGGHLSQFQVQGIEAILDEWEVRKLTDLRWLAYMLATTYWETAHTMQPIEEYPGSRNGRAYNNPDPETGKKYFGRGFVQLTHKGNYAKMSKYTGEDLVKYPDKALKMIPATIILFEGMIQGLFTGVKLATYFNDTKSDWVNARKIINGTDKANLIAQIALQFYTAMT